MMFPRSVEVLAIGHAAYDMNIFLDSYPQENCKVEVHDALNSGGGPAANATCLLALWGVACSFAGLIGDDYFGQRAVDELTSLGVDLSLTEIRHGYPTPSSLIIVNTCNGSRTIINCKAHGSLDLDRSRMAEFSPQLLFLDGHEFAAARTALDLFPDSVSVLDAGSVRQGTKELIGKVDYLVASETFARQVTNLPDLLDETRYRECLRRLRESVRLDTNIVVTLGERGLIYDNAGTCIHLPAYPASVVDTTGSGDIFHGAFAYCILHKVPIIETLKTASMAAALSVQRRGGRLSIPTFDDVRRGLHDVK